MTIREVETIAAMWELLQPFNFDERVRMLSYLHSRAIDPRQQVISEGAPKPDGEVGDGE